MKKAHHREHLLLLLLFVLAAAGIWMENKAQTAAAAEEMILLPIAMYHSVTDEGDSPSTYVISPKRLEEDLNYLLQNGFETVTIDDLLAYVQQGKALPEKPVMLTFDDGYYNNYKYAYPLLKKYHMKAILSPVGKLTEQFTETNDPKEHETWSYCTGTELKEMADSGVIELQNHSYDFHELSGRKGCLRKQGESQEAYKKLFLEDTQRAQQIFVSLEIAQPTCYTYPYGARNQETDTLVEECGFAASFGCEEGIQVIKRDRHSLTNMRRYNRDGRLSSEQFWKNLLKQTEEAG